MSGAVLILGGVTVLAWLVQVVLYFRLQAHRRDRMRGGTVSDSWDALDALEGLVKPDMYEKDARALYVAWVVAVGVAVVLGVATLVTFTQ